MNASDAAGPRSGTYSTVHTHTQVVTWETANGKRINLTPAQSAWLDARHIALRHSSGHEYCRVYRGLHRGDPTWTDAELERRTA